MQEPTQPERLGFGIWWGIYEPQRLWISETPAFLGTKFLLCLGAELLRTDLDPCHHPARFAEFRAMREEALGVTRRTAFDDGDVLGSNPRGFELTLVRRHQVEMSLWPKITMSRRALVQKQHWILGVNRIGVEDLFEQFTRIRKLRFELGAHFVAYGIATLADARPDRGAQIAGRAAELATHFAHALLHHASNRSAPTCVKRAHYAALRIRHQHRNTIGGLDCQQKPGRVGDHAVTGQHLRRDCTDAMDDGGVNLPDLHQRPQTAVFVDRAQRFQKQRAIALDVGMGIVLRLSKVECLSTVAGGYAALACAESVDQPRDSRERFGA